MTPPSERHCAAVCRNGHVIHDELQPPTPPRPPGPPAWVEGSASIGSPAPVSPLPGVPRFCGRCGAPVLQGCGSCGALLLGAVRVMPGLPNEMKEPDSFCWDCGEPYPWASREERVVKLFDRIDHEDLDEATLLTVREQIAVLSAPVDEVTDNERVRAGHRIMSLAPEAQKALLPVLQGLLTAEAKRRLGLPQDGGPGPGPHGERQLIGFPHAWIADPAVLLLNEATSNLDVATEAHVQQALRRLPNGRTTVTIAHWLTTVLEADQAAVIENGRVVEAGPRRAAGGRWALRRECK